LIFSTLCQPELLLANCPCFIPTAPEMLDRLEQTPHRELVRFLYRTFLRAAQGCAGQHLSSNDHAD
jgi:hypothetical protein